MTAQEENQIFLDLMSIHPLTTFDENNFLDLLEHSLSLNVFEKKRVIDSIPNLSQFQIDELVKVFVDEREEFKKLLSTEWEAIKELVIKQKEWWNQLREIYIQETLKKDKEWEDQSKIDDLKSSLGL
ncbi:MAG: hypothetical protein ACD_4C00199G0003 [uncultured bacterium (gcode 4)]|uniref:Uncharacterized protein n=1 Tax=uncultured bacterium (gcode 4) TaxID=1234023 RepID=K2G973_9BACT|nr:MAG: hypothetical protein ACD_4C00199G0003 [uncultured bacterium (gcode 4)]